MIIMEDRGTNIMSYEQACSEMNFILNNLNFDDLEKIPQKIIQFFADNMDKEYQVDIDLDKPLYEQDLLEETKAFIKIIQINYFIPKEKRAEKIAELGMNDIDDTLNYDKLFQNNVTIDNDFNKNEIKTVKKPEIIEENIETNTSLIKYKDENKIIKFFKNIFNKIFGKK